MDEFLLHCNLQLGSTRCLSLSEDWGWIIDQSEASADRCTDNSNWMMDLLTGRGHVKQISAVFQPELSAGNGLRDVRSYLWCIKLHSWLLAKCYSLCSSASGYILAESTGGILRSAFFLPPPFPPLLYLSNTASSRSSSRPDIDGWRQLEWTFKALTQADGLRVKPELQSRLAILLPN